jgi:endonuclease/exonuclease/phosphatase family metal-dependent hydrolase
MKIIFWNLGYVRQVDGSLFSYIKNSKRLVHHDKDSQKKVIEEVAALVTRVEPDVFAYAEILTGSKRNQYFNQHRYLRSLMSREHHVTSAVTKYGNTIFSSLPFHKGNSNGVISFLPATITNHYLQHSRKKLIQEIRLEGLTLFVGHLPLVSRDREKQFKEIAALVNGTEGDVVLCGDFNILNGFDELDFLKKETGLRVAGENIPTFPSRRPKIQIDVFMYRFADTSKIPKFSVIKSLASDHLPIVLEW